LTPIHRNPARPATIICACLLLPVLFGCQGHKIMARINGESINDDQYQNRLERVSMQDFQPMMQSAAGIPIDAGSVALVNLIRERAVDLLAKQKNAVPSADTVESLLNYQKLAIPNLANLLKTGAVSEDDLKRNLRVQAEAVGIGTDGAQVDAKELNDAFNAAQNSANPAEKLDIPEKYGMRLLRVKDADDGLLVLGRLRASGRFEDEARQEGDRGQLDGTEQVFPVTDIQSKLPALYDAMKTLSPGQFAPAPITLTIPQSTTPQSLVVVAQMTKKIPAHKVTLDEVRPELTSRILQKKFGQWQMHFVQTLNDFLRSKDTIIEIDIDRYKPLIPAFLKTPNEAVVAPSGAAPGASAPPGSAAPGMTSPPPSAGSGAMAPPSGKTP